MTATKAISTNASRFRDVSEIAKLINSGKILPNILAPHTGRLPSFDLVGEWDSGGLLSKNSDDVHGF